ncbi:hypothetical protein SUNI508_07340 [Seiridium unicorne]|uniref:Uncharacterized protein n=1 Tax=Seiridium unicorne TaxID=138068 RepID=A0ABR2UYH2_9PEZI
MPSLYPNDKLGLPSFNRKPHYNTIPPSPPPSSQINHEPRSSSPQVRVSEAPGTCSQQRGLDAGGGVLDRDTNYWLTLGVGESSGNGPEPQTSEPNSTHGAAESHQLNGVDSEIERERHAVTILEIVHRSRNELLDSTPFGISPDRLFWQSCNTKISNKLRRSVFSDWSLLKTWVQKSNSKRHRIDAMPALPPVGGSRKESLKYEWVYYQDFRDLIIKLAKAQGALERVFGRGPLRRIMRESDDAETASNCMPLILNGTIWAAIEDRKTRLKQPYQGNHDTSSSPRDSDLEDFIEHVEDDNPFPPEDPHPMNSVEIESDENSANHYGAAKPGEQLLCPQTSHAGLEMLNLLKELEERAIQEEWFPKLREGEASQPITSLSIPSASMLDVAHDEYTHQGYLQSAGRPNNLGSNNRDCDPDLEDYARSSPDSEMRPEKNGGFNNDVNANFGFVTPAPGDFAGSSRSGNHVGEQESAPREISPPTLADQPVASLECAPLSLTVLKHCPTHSTSPTDPLNLLIKPKAAESLSISDDSDNPCDQCHNPNPSCLLSGRRIRFDPTSSETSSASQTNLEHNVTVHSTSLHTLEGSHRTRFQGRKKDEISPQRFYGISLRRTQGILPFKGTHIRFTDEPGKEAIAQDGEALRLRRRSKSGCKNKSLYPTNQLPLHSGIADDVSMVTEGARAKDKPRLRATPSIPQYSTSDDDDFDTVMPPIETLFQKKPSSVPTISAEQLRIRNDATSRSGTNSDTVLSTTYVLSPQPTLARSSTTPESSATQSSQSKRQYAAPTPAPDSNPPPGARHAYSQSKNAPTRGIVTGSALTVGRPEKQFNVLQMRRRERNRDPKRQTLEHTKGETYPNGRSHVAVASLPDTREVRLQRTNLTDCLSVSPRAVTEYGLGSADRQELSPEPDAASNQTRVARDKVRGNKNYDTVVLPVRETQKTKSKKTEGPKRKASVSKPENSPRMQPTGALMSIHNAPVPDTAEGTGDVRGTKKRKTKTGTILRDHLEESSPSLRASSDQARKFGKQIFQEVAPSPSKTPGTAVASPHSVHQPMNRSQGDFPHVMPLLANSLFTPRQKRPGTPSGTVQVPSASSLSDEFSEEHQSQGSPAQTRRYHPGSATPKRPLHSADRRVWSREKHQFKHGRSQRPFWNAGHRSDRRSRQHAPPSRGRSSGLFYSETPSKTSRSHINFNYQDSPAWNRSPLRRHDRSMTMDTEAVFSVSTPNPKQILGKYLKMKSRVDVLEERIQKLSSAR